MTDIEEPKPGLRLANPRLSGESGCFRSHPACSGIRHRLQIAHPNQVVDGRRKLKHPVHSPLTSDPHLAHQPDRLQPAEDLFHPFSLALTDPIPGMPRRSSVEGASAPRLVLGYMRCDVHPSEFFDKLARVVSPIGSQRDPLPGRNPGHHPDCRLSLLRAPGHRHSTIHRQSVPVLHQHMAQVAELRFRSLPLAIQFRLRVRRRPVRRVAAFLPPGNKPSDPTPDRPSPSPRTNATAGCTPAVPSASAHYGWNRAPAAAGPAAAAPEPPTVVPSTRTAPAVEAAASPAHCRPSSASSAAGDLGESASPAECN